jgi:hypothetical protein
MDTSSALFFRCVSYKRLVRLRARLDKTDGLSSVRRKRPFPTGKRTLPSNGRFSQTPSSKLDDISRLSKHQNANTYWIYIIVRSASTTARSARIHAKGYVRFHKTLKWEIVSCEKP